jgi:transcription antitermination factor NusA-like protein
LDGAGLFSRVYLRELRRLGDRLQPAVPSDPISQEIRDFALFLEVIAAKAHQEHVPLDFEGGRMNLSFVLVADEEVIAKYGLAAHERRVVLNYRRGAETVYIQAWGSNNIAWVKDLGELLQSRTDLAVIDSYEYPMPRYMGSDNHAILLVCAPTSTHLRHKDEMVEPVRRSLATLITEIRDGTWEVVQIEREPGRGSKVAVRMADTSVDPLEAIQRKFASDPSLGNELSAAVGEPIGIVPWSSDLKRFIAGALFPMERRDIIEIVLDQESLIATVFVFRDSAIGWALGRDGWNIRTAGRLVGWEIRVEHAAFTESDADREARRVLSDAIQSLGLEGVEVTRVARQLGVGCKAAIRCASAATLREGTIPSLTDDVRARLGGEWVSIVEMTEDPETLIRDALRPLRHLDVLAIVMNEDDREAIVDVRSVESAAVAIGTGGVNVRLAERLTGWAIEIRPPSDGGRTPGQVSPAREGLRQ